MDVFKYLLEDRSCFGNEYFMTTVRPVGFAGHVFQKVLKHWAAMQ